MMQVLDALQSPVHMQSTVQPSRDNIHEADDSHTDFSLGSSMVDSASLTTGLQLLCIKKSH